MKRRYILEAFNSYRAEVIPPGASTIQVEECKRAFFAGAATIAGLINPPERDPLDHEESEARENLKRLLWESIRAEIGDFPAEVIRRA